MHRLTVTSLVIALLIVSTISYSPAIAGQELIDAAGKGDLKTVQDLLNKGQNVNSRDETSWTVLMEASKAGHLDLVKVLLGAKALVNAKDKDGATALMAASYSGQDDIVRLLLENGAEINAEARGATALGWASMKGREQVVALLKASGAKDLGSDYQNTAFREAAATNDIKQVQELLDKGVDVNAKEIGGQTALISSCIAGHVDVARLLLERGANVAIKEDKDGSMALIQAAGGGHLEIVRMLLAKGADVNAKDNHGCTALIGASEDGHLDVVRLLLQAGADVNSKYKDGSTALMSAAIKDHAEVVRVLLEGGADINVRDNKRKATTLIWAALEGCPNAVKVLLEAGADVDATDREGSTALIAAAMTGHAEAVKLLLDRGAHVNLKDNEGITALAWAAFTGRTAVVDLLLARGADIAARDSRGLTVLMNASIEGRLDAMRLLIEKGADVNAKDSRGVTALYWASANGHSQLVELLKAHGAHVKAEEHGALLLTIQEKSDQPVTTVMAALRKRAIALGASKDDVVQTDSKTVSVRLPGYKGKADKAVRIMEKRALLEFKLVDKEADVAAAERGDVPEGDELIYQEELDPRTGSVNRRPWVVKKQPLMTGEALSAARPQRDQIGRMIIAMDFDSTGARQLARITKDHVGDKLAIILDNKVHSAPVIKMAITMGSAIIDGQFSPDEAAELALALSCGPMAAPVKVVKSEWLGSSTYKIKTDEPSDLLLALRTKSDQPVTRVIDAIRNRAAALGASKDDVVQTDSKTVSIRLAGYKGEADKAARIMAKQGLLEFKLVDKGADVAAAERGDIPEGDELIYQEGRTPGTGTITRRPWVVMKQPLMTANVLSGVTVQPDPKGGMFIGMEFNSVGAREFERITSEHVNERLAIVVDNEVYSVPTIRDRVSEGKALIVGEFTPEEVEELALVLRCGPLAVPMEIVKSEWIKPSSANK